MCHSEVVIDHADEWRALLRKTLHGAVDLWEIDFGDLRQEVIQRDILFYLADDECGGGDQLALKLGQGLPLFKRIPLCQRGKETGGLKDKILL